MGKKIIITESQYKKLLKDLIEIEPTETKIKALYESSWSRVLQWIDSYDIATITAFRGKLQNVTDKTYIPNGKEIGDTFTLQENRQRNRLLKAKLLSFGYGVTAIHGSYIEGANGTDSTEVAEESFFVVNLKNDTNFFSNLFALSEYFNQDSFLYKSANEEDAYLVGTNNNGFPEYGEKLVAGKLTSLPSKFMSRIKNAAFAFVNKDNWIVKQSKEDLSADDMNDFENSYSWKNDEKPTFQNRKAKRGLTEDWVKLYKDKGVVLETLDDYSMGGKQAIGLTSREVNLNERSINAKIRDRKNAINTIKKGKAGYRGISHFGVLTAENPDSMELPRKENSKLLNQLKKSLKTAHYIWEEQIGHFGGNDEHSLFIFNASVQVLSYFSGKYQQTSFIYGELKDGKIHSEYWEKQDITLPYDAKKNPYVRKDACDEWHDASNDENYSVIGKNFKYTIPFSIFNDIEEQIETNLSMLNENEKKGALNIAMNGVGSNAWNYRGFVYKNLLK